MGLRVRPGLHYAPIDGGIYLSSARATFVMSGPPVLFRVVDTCVPLLEDGTDRDSLVAALGTTAAGPLVDHLLKTLDSRGLLLRGDEFHGREPNAADRGRFPEALAYLETHQDQPYEDFRRIRASAVLVAGPHEALGPATRGLLRAGVGTVVVATTEPARMAALAARNPEIGVVRWAEGEALPVVDDARTLSAAVVCSGDQFPEVAVAELPPGCLVVPVRLGKDVAIVGPAFAAGDHTAGIEALWDRATMWSSRGGEPRVRPSGDLLAGALAGQMAFDALVGLSRGQVHVIHGGDLNADSFVAAGNPTAPPAGPDQAERASELDLTAEATAEGTAEPAAGNTAWHERLSAPWTGLFRLSVPDELPQLPLALTVADGESLQCHERVIGYGPDQAASTTEAALEGLRRHCAGLFRAPAGDHLERWVAAAGQDRTEWLLDGALRLLANFSGEEAALDWLAVDGAAARRLWRALEEYELVPVQVSIRQVPDFAWRLAVVRDRRSGDVLAEGWGPNTEGAAATALAAAVARQQAGATLVEPAPANVGPPGFHHRMHQMERGDLVVAVRTWLTATGQHLSGRRLTTDTVAGPIGVWCGAVSIDD
ncbi:MAG TPA: hypothetical protein VHT75_06965 [Acidimicrobiales bacterium]|jgi:hypothetical protein|nr:hypothetical protein [Acidimicrobiales bacterium]